MLIKIMKKRVISIQKIPYNIKKKLFGIYTNLYSWQAIKKFQLNTKHLLLNYLTRNEYGC
uniref:Cytochrome b6-f complex subunit PetP n=1 Tax=Laurencia catarinensis TaxID=197326 RepID=UPI0028D09B0B|nr:Cytochrome b6-f complex subunit PetP [Laurencia catarinensis]WMP12500.1 Cytochrome b6-f complex subunit PetP [Laurencia catarinensis]